MQELECLHIFTSTIPAWPWERGPYGPLGVSTTGSVLVDLAEEPLRVEPELVQAVRVGGVRSPQLALILC